MLANLLTSRELQAAFITVFIISLILFIYGIFFIRWYAKRRGWDESFGTAFIVSLLWFVINISFEILFLSFFINSIGFVPFIIVPEIMITSLVVAKYYNKKYLESLNFVIFFMIPDLIIFSFTPAVLFIVGLYYINWNIKFASFNNSSLPSISSYKRELEQRLFL